MRLSHRHWGIAAAAFIAMGDRSPPVNLNIVPAHSPPMSVKYGRSRSKYTPAIEDAKHRRQGMVPVRGKRSMWRHPS